MASAIRDPRRHTIGITSDVAIKQDEVTPEQLLERHDVSRHSAALGALSLERFASLSESELRSRCATALDEGEVARLKDAVREAARNVEKGAFIELTVALNTVRKSGQHEDEENGISPMRNMQPADLDTAFENTRGRRGSGDSSVRARTPEESMGLFMSPKDRRSSKSSDSSKSSKSSRSSSHRGSGDCARSAVDQETADLAEEIGDRFM